MTTRTANPPILRPTLRRIHGGLVWLVLAPVFAYRALLSPLKRAPTCRYLPTCSEYAITAVRTRGIAVGGLLALWRLLRCNPLFHGGHDPVPTGSARRCAHHVEEQA
jgi:putative membrane protein insertion efficiency factor